jgi:FPC/CPF motif-containing protein YcgG
MSNKDWTFCFDGATWFTLALTPGHVKRQSRHSPNLVYVFQPKWIFEILFSTPRKREATVEKVRKLLVEYDEVGLSPDLGPYGAEGFRESRQYCLLDENRPSDCPYADLG